MGVSHCCSLARRMKQLSNPVSLAIISVLHRHHSEKIGVKRLATLVAKETGDKEMSQPGLSHRLRELSNDGLLCHVGRKYTVVTGELQSVVGTLCNYTGITQGSDAEHGRTGEPEP